MYTHAYQCKKSYTLLHISCKMCKFLALLILHAKNRARFLHQLSCKMKILHNSLKILQVSCTRYLTFQNLAGFLHEISYISKSCKFLPPAFLQDEILQVTCTMEILQVACKWVCKWKSCMFLIQTFVLIEILARYYITYLSVHYLGFLLLCKATLAFWIVYRVSQISSYSISQCWRCE